MRKFFLLLLIVFILLISFFFLVPKFLIINNIQCSSQYGPCSLSVAQKLTSLENMPLAKVRNEIKKTLSGDKQIEDFRLKFNFPDKLVLHLIEVKPFVALTRKDADLFALIDSKGKIIKLVEKTDFPVLVVMDYKQLDLNVGVVIEDEILFASKLLVSLFEFYNVRLAHLEEDGLKVNLYEGQEVIFPLLGEIDLLLEKLSFILSGLNSDSQEFKIEDRQGKIKTIDLRYENPVIR